jgi:adenosylcobyric acid synthase
LALLEPEERALIKGIVINKFRGQRSLLDSGIEWLENYTGIPVLGVIPWSELLFPAEDSLSLLDRRTSSSQTDLTIAVIRLPHIANFNDFDPLETESNLTLKYVKLEDSFGYPDAVIIPGTKTTINDLIALHESGMAEQLRKYAKAGGVIFGICGGYQMLGKEVSDLEHCEGSIDSFEGLKLLPIKTLINTSKIVQQRQSISYFPQAGLPVVGYEIHQGMTQFLAVDQKNNQQNYLPIFEDLDLGIVNKAQSIWGTYLHSIFDNGPWRRTWLNFLRKRRGLPTLPTGIPNYQEQREAMLDNLADLVDQYVDLRSILTSLQEDN